TMSFIEDIQHPVIDNLIAASDKKLEWIPSSQIINIESSQIDIIYYASKQVDFGRPGAVMLLLLGSTEECTSTLMSEFARIYSIPTHAYNNVVSQYRRHSKWLDRRNERIIGFTKYDNNYYMV